MTRRGAPETSPPVRPADGPAIAEAAAFLRAGGLVAFPTETVYGLGANARDERAVRRIFEAKGRPSDNPLILHVADVSGARALAADWPEVADRLAASFWPGPLTLVLDRAEAAGVAAPATGGLASVAVRVPGHPVARALVAAAGVPVAAPSANRSGSPSPTRASHVASDLAGRVDLVLDGGSCDVGVESTVVDVRGARPLLLRPGSVTVQELEAVAGPVDVHPGVRESLGPGDAVASPGMKYRHYAPRTPLTLFEGSPAARVRALVAARDRLVAAGRRPILVVSEESGVRGADVHVLGKRGDARGMARRWFALLRDLDEVGGDEILVEGVAPEGVGLALQNRLRKAAGDRVVDAGAT